MVQTCSEKVKLGNDLLFLALIMTPTLIIGLGNPEKKYDKTRHNIGFEAIDRLAARWQWSWKENKRFQALIAEGISPQSHRICLLKPLTYMNRSGQAARAAIDWYKFNPEATLVIYDDMDLPLGRIRLRLSGSSGGHNGMKSLIAHLGTQNFPRLRIGIGKAHQKDTIAHVLGQFAPDEHPLVDRACDLSLKAIECSLKGGIEKAMSLYNSQTVTLPSGTES
jgi:PTH1 family peptidyl-tRNA hydrolase